MGDVNKDMIVLARDAAGLTQTELAERAGVSQAKISKYENGILAVTDIDLDAICAATGYHRDFFYSTEPVFGLGSAFLFNRKKLTAPIGVQRRVQARVNIARLQISRLLRAAEIDAAHRFERIDIESVEGGAAEIAKRVRAAWRIPLGPVQNVTVAIESAGGLVLPCDFGTRDIDAAHLWLNGEPPMFFINSALPGDRYRFTLTHELGHAIMHRFPQGDIEAEANAFAREFLMPAREIAPELSNLSVQRLAQLKQRWKVAMSALVYQAHALGCITKSRCSSLFSVFSRLGYRKAEPIDIAMEQPTMLPQLLELHRTALGYTDADLLRVFMTDSPDFFDVTGDKFRTPFKVTRSTFPFPARLTKRSR